MRYQALVLIFVILVSASAFRAAGFLSSGSSDASRATITTQRVESGGANGVASPSLPSVQGERSVPGGGATIPVESGTTDVVEQSAIEKPAAVSGLCDAIGAQVFLVRDFKDDGIIFEKYASKGWPIASVTKLMTALVALEHLELSRIVTITPEVIKKAEGYSSFSAGERYSIKDLIAALLVFSSNDAAYALADAMGEDAFVNAMNKKARELGMNQARFFEPSGLSYLNQSTAYDLYALAKYIYHYYPLILENTRKTSVSIKDYSTQRFRSFSNVNLFAGKSNFFGGKTGFIDESGGNLVTLFSRDGTIVFIAVMGSPDRFGDTERLYACLP